MIIRVFSNRGRCYFVGHRLEKASMWQTLNLTDRLITGLVAKQSLYFKLSGWLGGLREQDDNAQVILSFFDDHNRSVGQNSTLGPVYAKDRNLVSLSVYREIPGTLPNDARSLRVLVILTRTSETKNDGAIDNLSLIFYQ